MMCACTGMMFRILIIIKLTWNHQSLNFSTILVKCLWKLEANKVAKVHV